MIKGKWYRESERLDGLFFRYLKRNKNGYLLFDKSCGTKFKAPHKFIHGYPGMERFLVQATKEEIKRFKLY